MPRFQLPIAVVLVASVATSFIVFLLTRTTEGKIQLPIHVNEEDEEAFKHDPFDVTKAEDGIDGYPIDGVTFWSRVRWETVVLVFLVRGIDFQVLDAMEEGLLVHIVGIHARFQHSVSWLVDCERRAL